MTIKATTENVASLVATKLTGAFPVLDASALTGINAGPDSGASDPTISTNPSGVGIVYENTTSGELFICIDATTGKNVWINAGSGFGRIASYSFQGTIAGFNAGSYVGDVIDKFTFASNAGATDHGDLNVSARGGVGAASSYAHGYGAGGSSGSPGVVVSTITEFPFASSSGSVDQGNLTTAKTYSAGHAMETHGFTSSGQPGTSNVINKYAFYSGADANDHGDMTRSTRSPGGHSSSTHGFTSGGYPNVNVIDTFPFAAPSGSVDHGDLAIVHHAFSSTSSTTHGYTAGGYGPFSPAWHNAINKFAFASNTTAADHGDLVGGTRASNAGQSSTTHGYSCGGTTTGGALQNSIEKYSYTSSAGSVDHGDLTVGRTDPAGHQY
jgi:hypothetical protein